MDLIPFIDWNGNGTIDHDDLAVSLAMAEEENETEDQENDDIQESGE